MPKRFITYSRTEPARTVLWSVAFLTLLAQVAAMVISWPLGVANFLVVGPVCIYALWAAQKNRINHMSLGAFWIGGLWCWSGLLRLFTAPDPSHLLWVPFMIISVAMAVVYIYLSNQKRLINAGEVKEVESE